MYFQQLNWFLINLLLATSILQYALLLDVLNQPGCQQYKIQWILFLNQIMIFMFCIFKSLIGIDMSSYLFIKKRTSITSTHTIFP